MAERTISKVKDSSLSSGKDEDPNSAGTIHLVFQRYRSCRILLNEQEWISVGDNNTRSHQDQRSEPQLAPPPQPPPPLPVPPDSHSHHCGLLVYVSFATGATKASVQAAAHTILHLPLLTTGLWGDGTSEQKSVMDFVTMRRQQQQGGKEPHLPSTSLVLCPQANLIGKVRGRSGQIQYHGQISKEQGHVLFEHLASCLIGLLLERQCELLSASRLSSAATTTTTTTTTSSSFPLPISYRQWKQELEREQQKLSWQEQQQNRNDTQPHASIAPQHLFRPQSSDDHNHDDSNGGGSSSSSYWYHASNYSAWNDDGLPTHDAKGEPMTKSALKKLKKLQEAHGKRHEKWLQKKKMGQPRQDNKDDNNHDNDRKDKITTTQEGSTKEKDHTIQLTSRSSSSNSNNKNDDDSPSPDNQQTVTTAIITTATTTTTALCPSWRQDLDPNFCSVIVGSFGKRQGLELCSDMGPFCHTFQV